MRQTIIGTTLGVIAGAAIIGIIGFGGGNSTPVAEASYSNNCPSTVAPTSTSGIRFTSTPTRVLVATNTPENVGGTPTNTAVVRSTDTPTKTAVATVTPETTRFTTGTPTNTPFVPTNTPTRTATSSPTGGEPGFGTVTATPRLR